MSSKVTDAEIRDHDKLLQTYRDKRTRCGHCEQLIMDWDTAHPLACLHVLCSEECLEANKIDDVYDCPTCHLSVEKNCLEAWRSIGLALFRKEALLICTHCVDKVPAIYWCAQCADSLCQPCREFHPKCVRFAKHTVTLLDPDGILDPRNDEVVCQKHIEKTVKYCITCNEALCLSPLCCRPHANHQLKSIQDFVKEFRTKIQKSHQNMSGFLAQTCSWMDSSNDETLDPQTNSRILNLFRTEFNRIMDLVAQSEELLKERESLKNSKVKSLRAQVSQFLRALGDTTGISNEIITQNFRILNDHFEEIKEGIAVCSDLIDDDDTIVEDYLPAFHQVTDTLEMLIKILSSERSPGIQITKELSPPSSSGTEKNQLATTAENGEETDTESTPVVRFSGNSVAGFSGNATKVTATPKVSKNQKDVEIEDIEMEIMEDFSSDSEEDEKRGRGRSCGQAEVKKTKDERSESGRDEGGASTRRSQSPNKSKNRRRRSQGNDKQLKSHKKPKPSTPTPTLTATATSTATATACTSTSAHNMEDIAEKEMCEMHGSPELIPTPMPVLKRCPGRSPPSEPKQGKRDDVPPKLEPVVASPATSAPGPPTPRNPCVSAPARIQSPNILSDKMKITTDSDDPNEDYCAVCLDGGDDVLVCCDDCPKVFHPNCHLPAMTGVPENDWQCMFCKPLESLPAHTFTLTSEEEKTLTATNLEVPSHLPRGRFLYACKFLCELYKGKDYPCLIVHYCAHLRGRLTDSPINLNYFRRRLTFGKPEPFQNTEDMIPLLRKMIARAKKVYKTSPIELDHVAAIDRKFNANISIYFPNLGSPQIPRRIANADDGEESDSDSEKKEEPSRSTESQSVGVVEIINQEIKF